MVTPWLARSSARARASPRVRAPSSTPGRTWVWRSITPESLVALVHRPPGHDELMGASSRRSVLHVSQPTEGGVGRYVAELAADQVARGWDVAVASPTYGELSDRIVSAGARHIPWTAGRMPGPSSALHAVSLARIVDRERPDLAHLHSSSAGLSGRLA